MKVYYPFETWKTFINNPPQYTPDNCDKAKEIFDTLISDLIADGENAQEDLKIKRFEKAIHSLNQLNMDCEGTLIETGEREQLCNLTNKITTACGLDPKKYNEGAGLADYWRDW
ncbi:MAG: hypothetical protein K0S32_798 [Bacteroidetes bacterium]|jgi:hypothetical protein|nr:hypothetical protein [Bacteroidota bacterium]